MATLDISGALNAIVQAHTPQAQMERNLALSMFGGKVKDDALISTAEYESAGKRHKKMLKEDEIDPNISAECMAAYKQIMDDNLAFHGRYKNGG